MMNALPIHSQNMALDTPPPPYHQFGEYCYAGPVRYDHRIGLGHYERFKYIMDFTIRVTYTEGWEISLL